MSQEQALEHAVLAAAAAATTTRSTLHPPATLNFSIIKLLVNLIFIIIMVYYISSQFKLVLVFNQRGLEGTVDRNAVIVMGGYIY